MNLKRLNTRLRRSTDTADQSLESATVRKEHSQPRLEASHPASCQLAQLRLQTSLPIATINKKRSKVEQMTSSQSSAHGTVTW